MQSEYVQLVKEALSGSEISNIVLPKNIETPWLAWESNGRRWAIYLINGKYWPTSTEKAIIEIRKKIKIVPCLLITSNDQVSIVAKVFIKMKIPVIVKIAEKGVLLIPPRSRKTTIAKNYFVSRIAPKIIKSCSENKKIRLAVRNSLEHLYRRYRRRGTSINDSDESILLNNFFIEITNKNGLSRNKNRAIEYLRNLEMAGMAGSRDHYFHSYQNFFFGLWAVGEANEYFKKWLAISKLNWSISPEFVWFLTALWHDVGYCTKSDENSESKINPESPIHKEGIIKIASFTEHLLENRPKTAWNEPSIRTRLSKTEEIYKTAILMNLKNGHSAAGALRLYSDMIGFIEDCANQSKRNILTQSLLIAAISIPFHDWQFRKYVRDLSGECKIPALTMPFATLLSFIDSIQEDRRQIGDINYEKQFLQYLSVEDGRVISADIDQAALKDDDIIWKIIEAKDISTSLICSEESIEIKYPDWFVA